MYIFSSFLYLCREILGAFVRLNFVPCMNFAVSVWVNFSICSLLESMLNSLLCPYFPFITRSMLLLFSFWLGISHFQHWIFNGTFFETKARLKYVSETVSMNLKHECSAHFESVKTDSVFSQWKAVFFSLFFRNYFLANRKFPIFCFHRKLAIQ